MTTRQAQNRTVGLYGNGTHLRSVVIGRSPQPKPISAEGIRKDLSSIIILLIAVVFVSLLLVDFSALCSRNKNIGALSDRIERVESSNSFLWEEVNARSSGVTYLQDPESHNLVSVRSIPAISITVPEGISR